MSRNEKVARFCRKLFHPSPDSSPAAAALIPVDFFEVKKKARGTYKIMGLLTVATLIVTSLTFVYLSFEGSKSTTTVTEVKAEDLSNKDGWGACTMISKVTDDYSLSENASFTLVNVMESKAECVTNLATAAPCESLQFVETVEPSMYPDYESTFEGNLEWFVCKNVTQRSVPSTSASLVTACSLNGVKWSAPLRPKKYATYSEYLTWALSSSTADLCTTATYDFVCNVVAELPPYVCTKEVKIAFSEYLGVAAANAELVYATLVFLCGLVLDYIGRYAADSERGDMEYSEEGIKSNEIANRDAVVTSVVSKEDLVALMATIDKKHAADTRRLESKISSLEEQVASIGTQF